MDNPRILGRDDKGAEKCSRKEEIDDDNKTGSSRPEIIA
jgi:hypothetical protein